jgi:hypothetical protein
MNRFALLALIAALAISAVAQTKAPAESLAHRSPLRSGRPLAVFRLLLPRA